MKSTKKLAKALLICTSLALLVACDDDVTNYPSDLSEYVLDQSGCNDETQSAITDNQYEDVYDNISDSNSVSAQTLDNILYKLAKENLIDDYEISDADFTEKYQQKMIDVATSGSYSTDNEFDEYRYALSLKSDMYDITTATGSTSLTDIKAAANTIVIDPDEYETVQEEFDAIFSLDYTDYITRY